MSKIAVVTDSSATVPSELVEELGIRVVPIMLNINGRSLRDGVDITAEEVYRWLRTSRHQPTTSAPSLGDFLRTFAVAGQGADGIVSIHLSPKLSAVYTTALTASRLVDGVPIEVINCHSAAMGQGFVVLEAARAAARGDDLEAVIARAREVASKVTVLATIDTLEHLHRGGRIGGAATLVGTMLQIKPVLYVANGHVDVHAKPRTKSRALRTMLQQMAKRANGGRIHAAILHADVPDEAEALRKKVEELFNCVELFVTELTPVMGVHTGPGVLGVAFYAE